MASSPQTTFCCDAIPICFARRVTLSRAEVAETLGCSQDFVDSLIADGTLRSHKARSTVFVVAHDVWVLVGVTSDQANPISNRARSILKRMGV